MTTGISPVLITFAFVCFAFVQNTQAVSPAPDGGYPGGNTAEGQDALFSLTSGVWNTALGYQTLYHVTTGNENTANGFRSLYKNTTGIQNTATGSQALFFNTIGYDNAANGYQALYSSRDNDGNTATGYQALYSTAGGGNNTATGSQSLYTNTSGIFNTASGTLALYMNTLGSHNVADDMFALYNNTTGAYNAATGYQALLSNTTGSYNIALGAGAGNGVTTANDVVCIGANVAGADVSNTTWICNVYGNGTISGQTAPVIVSVDGQLATVVSSERFKKDIATMEEASEAILSLRPVKFHYKTDSKGIPQFGLIAEEVAKVNPALVLPDKEGKPYTVRYDAVNAMLLNEFLKEHKRVEKQQATITRLTNDFQTVSTQQRNEIQLLSAQLKEQAAQIQKVSAELEASKPTSQVVNNP